MSTSLRRLKMRMGLAVLAVAGSVPLAAAPTGSVVLDGSYGTSGALTGPNYQVTAGMGLLKGNNLFQSFSTFNLVNGESATFSGPANVQNILARVTGGSASSIDGTINSSILGANLFLLNPAGVMFGPNAQVNVTGAFMVGTPNYVKLSNGGMFYTSLGGHDNLTSAAYLLAPGGNLTFFSAAGSGEVPFSLTPTPTQYSTSATTVTKRGNITLNQNSQAEIDGNGGGSVVIRGGKLTMVGTGASGSNTNITSGNYAGHPGGNVNLDVDDMAMSDGAFIGTEDFGGANAGSITVKVANQLSLSDADTQISSRGETSGNSGDVSVSATSIDLNDGQIFSVADIGSTGKSGALTVNAGSVTMEGNARLSSFTGGTGNAGKVDITLTGSLTMGDGSAIIANTYGQGQGGEVDVTAPQISMSDQSLITANTVYSSGTGGHITVKAGQLSIQGTPGAPVGLVGITAIADPFVMHPGDPLGTGNAGVINVTAGTLSLTYGAVISSASFTHGNGGDVSVNCAQAQLANKSQISASSVLTDAGKVNVTATDSFQLLSGSSVSTSAADNGGSINLSVGRLLYLLDSNIQAFAGTGGSGAVGITGGNIYIDPQFVALGGSYISANDLSPGGTDGNITNLTDFFFSSDSLLHATGTIETTSPDLDLGESLVALPANLDSAASQLRERCEQSVNHEFSTFIVVGRGGIEPAPGELQSDFGLSSN